MALRISKQTSSFVGVFIVSKLLLGIRGQKELKKKNYNFVLEALWPC